MTVQNNSKPFPAWLAAVAFAMLGAAALPANTVFSDLATASTGTAMPEPAAIGLTGFALVAISVSLKHRFGNR